MERAFMPIASPPPPAMLNSLGLKFLRRSAAHSTVDSLLSLEAELQAVLFGPFWASIVMYSMKVVSSMSLAPLLRLAMIKIIINVKLRILNLPYSARGWVRSFFASEDVNFYCQSDCICHFRCASSIMYRPRSTLATIRKLDDKLEIWVHHYSVQSEACHHLFTVF